jgi:integrase/recombinase XerD
VLLIAGSGLRLNEARELTLEDVDWSRRVVTVRSETSKSGRTRETRLDPQAAASLDSYVRDWRPPMRGGPVFLSAAGKPMSHYGFGHIFTRLAAKLVIEGVQGFMAHRLRHTWATNYRRVGAGDRFDLQDEGGWRGVEMVRRYSQRRPMEEKMRRPSPHRLRKAGVISQ